MNKYSIAGLLAFALAMGAYGAVTIDLTPAQITVVCNSQGGCGSTPTPPPPPTPPPVSTTCAGFSKTLVMTMDWANPTRLFTENAGGFGANDALVIVFTTGSVASSANLPHLSAAEWNSSASSRTAVLASTPCTWAAQSTPGATVTGNSITGPFTVASTNNYGYYPILNKNTTYYWNIRNNAPTNCYQNNDNCNMFIDLFKPGGM